MKSSHTEEEINQSKAAVSTLGGRIEAVKDYQIPAHRDVEHLSVLPGKLLGPAVDAGFFDTFFF